MLRDGRRRAPLAAAVLALYTSYLVAGLVSNTLWDRWLWFPIAVGLAASATAVVGRRTSPEPSPAAATAG
ncbi:hypothetical protein BH20ACT2_BH20ACT2_25030 [soil metagenome]